MQNGEIKSFPTQCLIAPGVTKYMAFQFGREDTWSRVFTLFSCFLQFKCLEIGLSSPSACSTGGVLSRPQRGQNERVAIPVIWVGSTSPRAPRSLVCSKWMLCRFNWVNTCHLFMIIVSSLLGSVFTVFVTWTRVFNAHISLCMFL